MALALRNAIRIGKSVTMARRVSREHPDLAVGHRTRRAGVLTTHSARRLALLQEPGLVDDQHRIVGTERLDHIVARDVAKRVRIPPATAKNRLLPPGSPAASARIQPVLRRSSPSNPSRNSPADAATRSCVNSPRIPAFTSLSDDAQSSSVVSIDAPAIHDLPTMVRH